MQKNLLERLGISIPVIQAPMAGGVTTTRLVTEVSDNGGLGMIGAGYMSHEQLREQVQDIKKLTDKPFGVNLFVPNSHTHTVEVKDMLLLLQKYEKLLGIEEKHIKLSKFEETVNAFEKQVDEVLSLGVPICSFTFGIPPLDIIQKMKEKGILLIGTATTVIEAIANEDAGMDAVVVQGSEAGGHRGNFLSTQEEGMIGLMSLIPQVVDKIQLPVIAAGGIMDGRGIMAARCLGAQVVQMGTAFLTCEESGAHATHKQAVLNANPEDISLTRAFSGKWARGVINHFMREMKERETVIPTFPIQNLLTQAIRKAAAQQNDREFMSLWSGQSPTLAKAETVKMLLERVMREVEQIKRNIY